MTPRQSDGVLWLWQTTNLSATEIGKRMGLTRSQVLGHVFRMREKGDIRAVSRRQTSAPTPSVEQLAQQIAELRRTVAAMRREQRKAA